MVCQVAHTSASVMCLGDSGISSAVGSLRHREDGRFIMVDLPKSVTIVDETMREGLQIEDRNIPVSEKLRLLDALGETGAKVVDIGSFGSPKWCPQMQTSTR